MTASSVRFTVFTPTYNRAHTLHRVYDSLRAQTFRDFEWLIVDDGSTDETEALVRGWMAEGQVPIRYLKKSNGGKPTAFNVGVRHARGELFLPLDSDDGCIPDALARLDRYWDAIDPARRAEYTGISVTCARPDGTIVGKPYPADLIDGDWLTMTLRGWVVGDKWGFHRTAVLLEHPFPELPGERFVPEGLVWNRIARRYRMRFINDPLQVIFEDSPDRITTGSGAVRAGSPRSAQLYYRELLEHARARGGFPFGARVRSIVNYLRFGRHAGERALPLVRSSGSPMLALLLLPAAVLLCYRDARQLRRVDRELPGQVRLRPG